MLYIVLALVVAALGLLIAALTTANTLWAWISVVVSVIAAALLVADWLNGRRAARANAAAKPTVVTVGGARHDRQHEDRRDDYHDRPDDGDDDYDDYDDGYDGYDAAPGRDEPDPVAEEPPAVARESEAEVTSHLEPVAERVGDAADPAEEPTDASDLLVVAGLDVEVRVVDEHPRYHLATCAWLGPRATIPIAVSEARQLGFTPCARCGPDAILAARHRAAR